MRGKRILAAVLCFLLLLNGQVVFADEQETGSASAEHLEILPDQNITVGETVTLEGSAEINGTPEATYRYIYYDGTTWREIASSQEFFTGVEWTPEETGDYLVAFQVQNMGQETNAFQNLHVGARDTHLNLTGINTSSRADGGIEIRPVYDAGAGASVSFTYMIYDLSNQAWYMLQENGGDTCVWNPTKAGDYWIHVAASNGNGTEVTHTMGYRVEGAKVTGISMDRDAHQVWNTQVTLTGTVSNPLNQKLQYEYLAYDGQYWKSLSKSSELTSCTYQAEAPGNYLLCFQAYDENNKVIGQSFMGYVAENSELKISGVTTSMVTGTGIQLQARYSTNSNDITFTYMIYDLSDQVWYMLQENGGDSCVWSPTKGGDYWIHVIGRTGDGREAIYTMGYRVENAKVTGISMDKDAHQMWDTEVVLTGTVSNPLNQKLVYEYLAYDGQYWTSLSKSEELGSYSYRAPGPGNYLLCFQAYDTSGRVIGQSFMGYVAERPSLTLGSIQTERVEEKKIHVSVSAETDDSAIEYRWLSYDLKNKVWLTIQDWSDKAEADWTPEDFGTYWIHVEARTARGGSASYTMGYQIEPYYVKLTNMQVYTPDYATYYIMQNVDTNDPDIQYLYQIYNLQTKKWMNLGTGHNTYWQPKSSGSYWIHVVITGSNGQTYENTIGYGIKGYRISNFGFSGMLQAGIAANLSLTGTDVLHEGYTFTYQQWTGSEWKTLYSGSEPKTVSWTPGIVGYYAFCCRVTNQDGVVVDEKTINISPSNFAKNGWYYENGYKFYYIDGVKQLDLDGILPKQSSYLAKINRTTCTVTIYAKDGNNGYIIPVKRFACSVGLPSTPTPAGTYYTLAKYRWHELMGPSYGQYCTRIVGGVLFHSVAGSNMTSYNLDPNAYNMLGSPASHGCVRLCVRDAKWIYDNCSLGMQVDIYDSPDPGPLGQGPIIRITDPNQNWDPTDPNV